MDSSGSSPAPARWISAWLALLAPLYPTSFLAVFNLQRLRELPLAARWLLAAYALSQQLPAVLAPDPLLASVLALVRTTLLLGMVSVGVSITRSEAIRPLGFGLAAVMLTALAFSAQSGLDVLASRLSHPYMTSNNLGMAGTLALFLALFTPGSTRAQQWARWTLGGLALTTLLLAGSRGALAAAVLGTLIGVALQGSRRVILGALLGAALLGGGALLGERAGVVSLTRLSTADTTGRDLVWANTLSVIQAHPWGGVGTFQLGRALMPGDCSLFEATDGTRTPCPEWLAVLGQPWIIAHNLTLHQLAETGPLGTVGLLGLILVGLLGAVWRRDALAGAVLSGLLLATVNDNTLLLPSPFFAEAFWILMGVQLRHWSPVTPVRAMGAALLAPALTAGVSLPVLGQWRSLSPQVPDAQLAFLSAPERTATGGYTAYARVTAPPGAYRLTLRSCQASCVTVDTRFFWVDRSGGSLVTLSGTLRAGPNTVTLALLPRAGGLQYRPLAQETWTVQAKVQP